MQYGVLQFITDYTIGPMELARAMEDRGLEALMVPEHTHIPGTRETPFPGGGELPREYSHTLDPFVALTAAAAVTERLQVGTGISLVIQHDPIILAKRVATLDLISGGRFLFGIGAGWNREEMGNHGTTYETRWKLLRERIEAMKALWTEEEASYHGDFVNFDKAWQWPKPVQKPHPPILMGGDGPRTLERVVRYADEWLPIGGRTSPEHLGKRISELRELAAAAERGHIPVGIYGCAADAAAVEGYTTAGAERLFFWMPPCGYDEAMEHLDRYVAVMKEVA
jgi:probable F420-dependent oxidoreductase